MSKCSVDGCERKVKARTYCDMHLARIYRSGVAGTAQPLKYNIITKEIADLPRVTDFVITKCRAADCNENSVGMGFCVHHYKEFGLERKGRGFR